MWCSTKNKPEVPLWCLQSKTLNNTPRHWKTDLWSSFEREPEYMKLSKLGHWLRADIGKINRRRCPIFPPSWKQIYIYIYFKKSLTSKVNACSLSLCRSTWAWGHKVWWKRELEWSAHGQEHLWHFILLWKWCNIALTLLNPEKMNQVQTAPEPQCSI